MCEPSAEESCPANNRGPVCGTAPLDGLCKEIAGELPRSTRSEEALAASGKVWAGTATARTIGDIELVLDILLDALQRNGFSGQEIAGIHLSLTEAIINAVKHGHRHDASKQVRIRYLINSSGLLAQVEDEGSGFRLASVLGVPPSDSSACESGRGLLLMQHHMTEVRYNGVGNCVTLIKRRACNGSRTPE